MEDIDFDSAIASEIIASLREVPNEWKMDNLTIIRKGVYVSWGDGYNVYILGPSSDGITIVSHELAGAIKEFREKVGIKQREEAAALARVEILRALRQANEPPSKPRGNLLRWWMSS